MCNRLTALALGGKVPNYLLRIKSTKRSMSKATEQKEPLYKVLTPPVKSLTDKKSYKYFFYYDVKVAFCYKLSL